MLEHAPPTLLGMHLEDIPVLDLERRQIDLTVLFARAPGQGQPSLGTRIHFTPCCELGTGVATECGEYLSIPPFATATSTTDEVNVTLRLTAAGETFVNQPGNAPADDLSVRVHAYAFGSEQAEATLSCAALGSDLPTGITTAAHVDVALRKAPQPEPE